MNAQIDRIASALRKNPDQYLDFLAKQDVVERILDLKEKRNALILGHNYMSPLVYQISEAGERGDSLALSQYAAKSDKDLIVFDGVKFMAETAKILNPEKKVLIPSLEAGCSLADPFKAEDVIAYKMKNPGVPVVTYINSYAEVKAESDYICTSANCMEIVQHAAREFGTKKVIFFPDSLMGANIQNEAVNGGLDLEIIYPGKHDDKFGRCEVHERFTAEQIKLIRAQYKIPKGVEEGAILVHWECAPEVLNEADFYGSTSEMGKYIASHKNLRRVWLGTECEMAANLSNEFPEVEFVKSCNVFCRHMRKITLEGVLDSLENDRYEINVDAKIAGRARVAIDRMLAIGRKK